MYLIYKAGISRFERQRELVFPANISQIRRKRHLALLRAWMALFQPTPRADGRSAGFACQHKQSLHSCSALSNSNT
jgi:hypothetical protein